MKQLLVRVLSSAFLLPFAVVAQQTLSDVKAGHYKGAGEEVVWFSANLVSTNDELKVSEIGYKFTGSLEVGRQFLHAQSPFGSVETNKLKFQFQVLVKGPSPNEMLTNAPGAHLTVEFYSAEISKADTTGDLKCKLTQIDKLDKEYEGFESKDVDIFGTPDKKLQKEYTITLKRVVE
jgi:hypothetical protein